MLTSCVLDSFSFVLARLKTSSIFHTQEITELGMSVFSFFYCSNAITKKVNTTGSSLEQLNYDPEQKEKPCL